MIDESERIARAGDYVLGRMDDEQRERAERDLERDDAFRDAVVQVAVRMNKLDASAAPQVVPDATWDAITTDIAQLPQMRTSMPGAAERAQVKTKEAEPATRNRAWRARLGVLVAAGLLAAFAGGYVVGLRSGGEPQVAGHGVAER